MKHLSIFVRAEWDEVAMVWVATSNDIAGLAVEAQTMEELSRKVTDAISDLIEMNGVDSDLAEIPVHIIAEQLSRVPNPCH